MKYLIWLTCVIGILAIGAGDCYGWVDLTISQYGVQATRNYTTGLTTVTVKVDNTGLNSCGSFTLRIKVTDKNPPGTSAWADIPVAGMAATGSKTKSYVFTGTNWDCATGIADFYNVISEFSESNNAGNTNRFWVIALPPNFLDRLAVINPGNVPKTISLYVEDLPPGWSCNFSQDVLALGPNEMELVDVNFGVPVDFQGYEEIRIVAEPDDGTPGQMDWTYHMFSPPSVSDVVVCEPQGGGNPVHPTTYWYDVTPGDFGRCDFHVQVFDSVEANYTNISLPDSTTWLFAVHKVGSQWWASWWDPDCTNAIFSTFRFKFDNPNPSTFGHWTTTISGTSNPYASVIDISAAHELEDDGYGYRVHVPLDEAPEPCDIPNGSFEEGQLDQLPPAWVEEDYCSPNATACWHDMKSVNTDYFDGNRSLYLYAKCKDGTTAESHVAYTMAWMEDWIDCPDAGKVRVRLSRQKTTTHTTYWGWGTHIHIFFTDGDSTKYAPLLFTRGEGYDTDAYDSITVGADGQEWCWYDRDIPAGIDKTHMKVGIRCYASGWSWLQFETSLSFYADLVELIESECDCIPGDADGSGSIDIDDVVYLIEFIFSAGMPPSPYAICSGDPNCSCQVDIDDVVYLIAFIFSGGPAPCSCEDWLASCGPPLRASFDEDQSGLAVRTENTACKTVVGTADFSSAIASGDQRTEARISIDADRTVQAVQLEYEIYGDVRDVMVESLVNGIREFHGIDGDVLRIGLLDLYGQTMIPPGETQIASISYVGLGEISLHRTIAVAEGGGRLAPTVKQTQNANIPKSYALHQNYPNPFNPATQIAFSLPFGSDVRLDIFNIMGQNVTTLVDGYRPAGTHTVTWDGKNGDGEPVASGVYFYRIEASDFSEIRKMLLLK